MDIVGAVFAGDEVIAAIADHDVVPGIAFQLVAIGAAVEAVGAVAAAHQVVAGTALQHVVAIVTVHLVAVVAAEQLIGSGPARQGIIPGAANQDIITAKAGQIIVAGIAVQRIVRAITDDVVAAGATNRIFDHHALGDRHIALQAADIRKGPGAQIDILVDGIAREIERVGSAGIPDREYQMRVGAGRRVEIAPGIGIEAIGRVARPRGHVGAVKSLRGGDVVDQRGGCIVATEISAGIALRPIAHH